MPTNLPPDYFEIERRYRDAESIAEKIACLEEMLSVIPKHKGTDKLRGDLRKKLSKLKSASQTRRRSGRKDSPYNIEREGAGQVAVIGPANTGKSALVATLTNASPEVAAFPFTTWTPTPGMMAFEDIQIQLVDTPPLNRDYVEAELLDLIKRSDVVLLVVDLQADPLRQVEETTAFLLERRIAPLHMEDRFAERRLIFVPMLVLANKNDDEGSDEDFEIFVELLDDDWPALAISVTTGRHLERLKRRIFEELDIIRVYSKAPGQEPDLSIPFVLEKGSTVEDMAGKVHKDFADKFKSARIWGSGAFEGQVVSRDHVLHDGDVVELHVQ